MAAKKKLQRPTAKRSSARGGTMLHLKILEDRVLALEHDTQEMRDNMERLSEDVQLLHATIKQMDERTIRGERLMMEMQGEQRQQSKVLAEISAHLMPKPGV